MANPKPVGRRPMVKTMDSGAAAVRCIRCSKHEHEMLKAYLRTLRESEAHGRTCVFLDGPWRGIVRETMGYEPAIVLYGPASPVSISLSPTPGVGESGEIAIGAMEAKNVYRHVTTLGSCKLYAESAHFGWDELVAAWLNQVGGRKI